MVLARRFVWFVVVDAVLAQCQTISRVADVGRAESGINENRERNENAIGP